MFRWGAKLDGTTCKFTPESNASSKHVVDTSGKHNTSRSDQLIPREYTLLIFARAPYTVVAG